MSFYDYLPTINTLRNVLDIALVFIIVYVVLKLLRGTRAVPTVVGMVILALLYWLALSQELSTLEFVLRYAVVYLGIAIIVLFQALYQGRGRILMRNSAVLAVNMAHMGDVGLDHVRETGQSSRSIDRPLPYAVPVLVAMAILFARSWR